MSGFAYTTKQKYLEFWEDIISVLEKHQMEINPLEATALLANMVGRVSMRIGDGKPRTPQVEQVLAELIEMNINYGKNEQAGHEKINKLVITGEVGHA